MAVQHRSPGEPARGWRSSPPSSAGHRRRRRFRDADVALVAGRLAPGLDELLGRLAPGRLRTSSRSAARHDPGRVRTQRSYQWRQVAIAASCCRLPPRIGQRAPRPRCPHVRRPWVLHDRSAPLARRGASARRAVAPRGSVGRGTDARTVERAMRRSSRDAVLNYPSIGHRLMLCPWMQFCTPLAAEA